MCCVSKVNQTKTIIVPFHKPAKSTNNKLCLTQCSRQGEICGKHFKKFKLQNKLSIANSHIIHSILKYSTAKSHEK